MRVVFLGLSITSSWGNGHATNYRALAAELDRRGHQVSFCERDVPWYAEHRDLPELPWGTLYLYRDLAELRDRCAAAVREADLAVVGSYVPEGPAVIDWVLASAGGAVAFYDIDTPVTLEKLRRDDREYLAPEQLPSFDLYLSFTGGPTLEVLAREWGVCRPRAFYCLVDPDRYRPQEAESRWALGYLGTYSEDRQPGLERLLLEPARRLPERRFAVAGPQYPPEIAWPENVERFDHVPPERHPRFYASQRFTLSVTRAQMLQAGFSPSVRLFEAAACGTPVISDRWPGVEQLFEPGREILIADTADDVMSLLTELPEPERLAVAAAARKRVLAEHTAQRRVQQLERELAELRGERVAA